MWWYLDALSDDGQNALTLIAFIGSVFSPYYAHRRRHGPTDPREHCAFNLALYGKAARRWTMTERKGATLQRDERHLAIGPSQMEWDGTTLSIALREHSLWPPGAVIGQIQVTTSGLLDQPVVLSEQGRHRWRALAPSARISVRFDRPALSWSGGAYLDSNDGQEPLERAFRRWDWSRALLPDGSTAVLYDIERRTEPPLALALRFHADGRQEGFAAPPSARLPRTRWGLDPLTRCDADSQPAALMGLEDGPFYARTLIQTQLLGTSVRAVHESLSLERFQRRWVQALLPFRMPRVG